MLKNVYRPQLADFTSTRALTVYAFFFGALVTLFYRPFVQAETGDQSIWDYMAQAILHGQIPYRDVIEIKSPLSAYLSAFAMFIGRLIGVSDVLSVRAFNVLLVGVVAALTFAIVVTFLKSRTAGILAFLVLLMSDHFVSWMISGTEPKLCMIIFGVLALLLIAWNRPFFAGLCSMLACLCWQPGLLFTGTAVLVFSNYLTRWRDGRAIKVIIGALLPLAIMIFYFAANHALGDLWRWTMEFNYRVYAPMTRRDDATGHLLMILLRVFKADFWIVIFSFCGFLLSIFQSLCQKFSRYKEEDKADLPIKDALWIPPLVYLIFCLINLQAGPDLLPLFPFIGIFFGFALVYAASLIRNARLCFWLPKGIAAILLLLALWRGVEFWRSSSPQLQAQMKAVEAIKRELADNEKIYVHGATEVLILLKKPNATPYIFLDYGKDDFIAADRHGNFDTILAEIDQQAPKIIILSRMKKVQHKAELRQWVEAHYDPLPITGFGDTFIRKSP
jgi:hypothetical protein